MVIIGYRYRSYYLGGKLVWDLKPPVSGGYEVVRFVLIDGQIKEEYIG